MASKRAQWWRGHFDAETLAGYGLGPKAAREVRGVMRFLRLRPGARVLDLCCGAGRHSVALAGRGLAVTGLDLEPGLLAAARESAREKGVRLELRRGDARRLGFRSRFDAVLSLFTSFGYFASEAEDLAVLRGARRALKPSGALLLDLLNKEWLMRHFSASFSRRGDGPVRGTLNRLAFDLERGRLDTRRTLLLKDGRRRETFLSIRTYSLVELIRLLDSAGLRYEKAWGGFDGRPYGLDTFRMIVKARRI